MGASTIVLLIVLIVAVAVTAALLVARQRRGPATPAAPIRPVVPEPPPMTGLESALSQVTDRSGRPIKEHIDAETAHVDDLRVPDDTGPLLRRALDHVSHAEQSSPHVDAGDGEPTESADPT